MLLKDKVAVITGSGRGIGRAMAVAYAREGAHLVLAARTLEELEETKRAAASAEREVLIVPTDVRDPQSVAALAQQTLAHFGRIDILVNNSGVAGPTSVLWEIDPQDWAETFAVNVNGTFLCCRAFLPQMIQQESGCILITGSMTGKRHLPGRTPYAASKLALVGLTRTLAWDAGQYGIRVNLISPGPVEGERIENVLRKQAEIRGISKEEARQIFLRDSPLAHLVLAEDVAETAVFLASDGARSITGEDLNVSAGITMY